MERIHHEKYCSRGRNFCIEMHRQENRVLFSVFDTAPDTALQQISITDQFFTNELTIAGILNSATYAVVLAAVKQRIDDYRQDARK